jgi:D-xylose 1-dehydrogenase (NADP+, D-xylono-1,5-lactone-forming)
MAKVKWGVLGCAAFARDRAIPAMLQTPSVELVGVASRSREKAEGFCADFKIPKAYGSYEEMLEDPEIQAIYNPLPNGLHGEWVIRAAEAGKHTLCEKPFTSNAGEAERVAEVVGRSGVKVMEAFMWRFHPQHERVRQVIDEGAIGTVRLVRAAFTFTIARKENIRLNPFLAGGSVMDVGCYVISGARFYFGAEPTHVFARGTFDPEFNVDMSMAGVLEFPTGYATLDCGFHLPFRSDVEIAGDKGSVYIPKSWLPDEKASVTINGKAEHCPPTNQYVNEFAHFSECVLSDTPPRYGPEDAVKQMRVIDAVYRSMRSGQREAV